MKKKNKVKTTKKLFDLLECLADYDGSMKLKDLSEKLGFPSSTTHRLVNSLREIGYIEQDQNTGEYMLGKRILFLAKSVLCRLNLRKIAYPYLRNLKEKTEETANLVVLDQNKSLYIEKVDSTAPVRVFSLIGKRAPLHATGVGKVLLADMAWPDVLSIINEEGLKKMTSNTIIDMDNLMEELNNIRKKGFAYDNEECELGAWCVAAPVRNYTGKVIASISVSMPVSRLKFKNKYTIIQEVKKEASKLSKELGFANKISELDS